MSVQVGPTVQGQHPLEHTPPRGTAAQDDAPDEAQLAAAGTKQGTNGLPQALNVSCNGNLGLYLLARRGVQCMCLPCQADRTTQPQAAWIMSPTEFERHSGMPTAKKWRMR